MGGSKRLSKARSLKNHLLKLMDEHRIPVGGQLPSESQLMQEFNISRSTVRQALTELSSEGLVERYQGRGTFRVANSRGHPTSTRLMLVGVWFNWPSGPLYAPIAEGIRDELGRSGYHAVFESGGFETGDERRGILHLVQKGLDGFIIAPSSNPRDEHEPLVDLINRHVPLVLVDRALPGFDADVVATDNEMGAEEMVQHLIELGHERIGFIGISDLSTIEDRHRGYRRTVERHGLRIEEDWVQIDEEVARDSGRAAAERILGLRPNRRPTAIFGANDMIAGMIAIVARERGLHVPRDLSLVGFDDVIVDPDRHSWLTTYAQPKYRIGQQAARLLLKRIAEPNRPNVTVYLPGRIIKRTSAGAPPETVTV